MLIIGNGESRSSIDVSKLNHKKIGCNAIHRDFKVDGLVCVDKRMATEAVDSKYHKQSTIYVRKDYWIVLRQEPNVRPLPELPYKGDKKWDQERNWGSGPYAVLLAAKLCKERDVKLLGFDLYGINDKVNNIYKDTKNYNVSNKRPVDPRYWIYQIGKVFECYPHIKFTIYQESDWIMPKSWKKSNVRLDKISNI